MNPNQKNPNQTNITDAVAPKKGDADWGHEVRSVTKDDYVMEGVRIDSPTASEVVVNSQNMSAGDPNKWRALADKLKGTNVGSRVVKTAAPVVSDLMTPDETAIMRTQVNDLAPVTSMQELSPPSPNTYTTTIPETSAIQPKTTMTEVPYTTTTTVPPKAPPTPTQPPVV